VVGLYQAVHPDSVLLDIFLPGTSGIEVLEQLKALDIHAPVIMLTGFGSENVAVAAMKAGAKDYMPKVNVNPQPISHSIRNVVDRVAMLRKIDAQHEELESFARVLAHDFTAPVTALQGSAALLTHEVSNAPRNLEKIGKLSGAIARNARRMGAFITTLTEYTSVDGVVEFGPVLMQRVLDDVLAILEVRIRERNATVSHDALPEVTGNSVLLTQLLQNLVCNALKCCQATPRVHVGASRCDDGERVVLGQRQRYRHCGRKFATGVPGIQAAATIPTAAWVWVLRPASVLSSSVITAARGVNPNWAPAPHSSLPFTPDPVPRSAPGEPRRQHKTAAVLRRYPSTRPQTPASAPRSELRSREGVAPLNRARLEPVGKPALPLLRSPVGKSVGHHVSLCALLQGVIADGRGRL
jgi:CheY-like chemotaxis protein